MTKYHDMLSVDFLVFLTRPVVGERFACRHIWTTEGDVEMKNKYHCWVLWRRYNHDIIISSLLKGKKKNSCISLLTCIGLERGGGKTPHIPGGRIGRGFLYHWERRAALYHLV